jgi:hypothetical protein
MRVHIISDMEGVSGIVEPERQAAATRSTTRSAAIDPMLADQVEAWLRNE